MDISLRRATQHDLADIARLDGASFATSYDEQDIADAALIVDPTRFWLAVAGERLVGVTGDYALQMTVPGSSRLDVPGVTWVSVSPTHRRVGILRRLMERQLTDYADRGEVLAILTATEAGIYRRFGYGPASHVRTTVIDRRQARLVEPSSVGRVELATAERARALLPGIHARWCDQTPGAIARDDARWEHYFLDRARSRGGMTERFYLVHPDGYVGYRLRADWGSGQANHLCSISDYVATTADAHAELWQVLLGMDLVGRIETREIPLDDPLPHLLTDPRALRTIALKDGVWVRLLDIATALQARTYALEIDTVLRVRDPLRPDAAFRLAAGPDGATCSRSDAAPDATLTVDALSSAYLGGHRLSELARAGRIEGDPKVLSRLDRAFLADRAPFHGTPF